MEKNGNGQIHKGKTNGHGSWPGDTSVTDNPFVSPRLSQGLDEAKEPKTEAATVRDAGLAPVAAQQKKNPKHKALIFSLSVLLLACVALGLYTIFGGRKSIDYRIADKQKAKPGERVQSGTGMEEKSTTSQATAEAINQAKEELRKAGGPVTPPVTSDTTPSAMPIGALEDGPRAERAHTGQIFTPIIIPETSSSSSTGKGAEQNGNEPISGRSAIGVRDARQANRSSSAPAAYSIYVVSPEMRGGEKERWRNVEAERRGEQARLLRNDSGLRVPNTALPVPSFGSMLPVRTLGAIFTLRNSLVRLETTRDIEGDGWKLKRGTVLVAQQQGSEHDRAFLSLIGFIDPETNRFVRLSGDLLGGDAAPGLKGKRRRISSRWTGVFNRVANSAVALGQAALSRGNSTTIITPGATGATGLGNEFGLSQSTLARREFVEVPAGAPAYVLVTDLPRETRGIDAEPVRSSGDDFLADEELAELLASGDPDQIRAALPRMQPEMRRVALLVLGEKGK